MKFERDECAKELLRRSLDVCYVGHKLQACASRGQHQQREEYQTLFFIFWTSIRIS